MALALALAAAAAAAAAVWGRCGGLVGKDRGRHGGGATTVLTKAAAGVRSAGEEGAGANATGPKTLKIGKKSFEN